MSAVADVRRNRTAGDIGFATVNSNDDTDAEIVAAVTGRKIRVLAMHLSAASAVDVVFEDAAGGADLTGTLNLTATDLNMTFPYNPFGWFETTAGNALSRDLSGAVAVTTFLVYVKI